MKQLSCRWFETPYVEWCWGKGRAITIRVALYQETRQIMLDVIILSSSPGPIAVREITKSSSHTMIYNNVKILILLPNLIAFFSQKEKNVWFFDYHLLTCSLRNMVIMCLLQNIDICLLYKSHQIARLVSHLIPYFSKRMFTMQQENASKFGTKNWNFTNYFISLNDFYGYIVVDSCIIPLNLNCIRQFKQFYNIATKVSSRKKCYYFWWSPWLHSNKFSLLCVPN